MESYTIEDIEIIRRKSGISYEEAVNLLEYHNGNLARALVDLERNGRMKSEQETKTEKNHSTDKQKVSNFFTRMFRFRFMVKKGDVIILNLSLLFSLVTLIISPHLFLLGMIMVFILGYKISFVRSSKDFAGDNLEKMVKNAAQNVKQTVSSFTKDLGKDDDAETEKEQAHQDANTDGRSYYSANKRASAPVQQTPPAPKASTTPVSVDCSNDGSVYVKEDVDGSSEATIE